MTREEAIDVLKNPNEVYQDSDGFVGYTFNPNRKNFEAFQLAIKALEEEKQELKQESVLDKIRAEIDEARFVDKDTKLCRNVNASGLEVAMQIIDKYKAESEDKE